jgi:hypothetical protein
MEHTAWCLEQIEKMPVDQAKDEVIKRLYFFVNKAKINSNTINIEQQTLIESGFDYFKSFYLLSGMDIQYCGLLSKKTLQKISDILQKCEKKQDGYEHKKLSKLINELDEVILNYLLLQDSKRFSQLTEKIASKLPVGNV